jgi:hypothetical protein
VTLAKNSGSKKVLGVALAIALALLCANTEGQRSVGGQPQRPPTGPGPIIPGLGQSLPGMGNGSTGNYGSSSGGGSSSGSSSGNDSGNGGGSGPSGGPPPQARARTYVYAACAFSTDTSDDCQKSVGAATLALMDAMQEEAISGLSKRQLVIELPAALERAEAIKAILEIEKNAIAAVQLKIQADLLRVEPMRQDVSMAFKQMAVARDVIQVQHVHEEAIKEAKSGSNWSHTWSDDSQGASRHVHTGSAYRQLQGLNAKDNWDNK